MGKRVVIDVLLVTLTVPQCLSEKEVTAIRRTLSGQGFRERLKRTVSAACRAFPSLRPVRFDISK
jgi:hypothetical protein